MAISNRSTLALHRAYVDLSVFTSLLSDLAALIASQNGKDSRKTQEVGHRRVDVR